jgi:putative flippase GtrA
MPDQNTKIEQAWFQHFRRLPQPARMVAVAILGALIGLLTYEVIYFLNPFEPRAPSSWLLSFAIAVPRQYSLHRWLTFESSVPYVAHLGRAYLLYSTIAILTTGLDWMLVEHFGMAHRLAWLACVSTTGVINLFALKPLVFGSHPKQGR